MSDSAWMWPPWDELLCGGFACFAGTFLAVGVGLGGGPLYLPALIQLFGNHQAVPISKLNTCAAQLAALLVNFRRMHPSAERYLINLDVALLLEPVTLLGSIAGVPLAFIVPAALRRTFLLATVLLGTLAATVWLAWKQWQAEEKELVIAPLSALGGSLEEPLLRRKARANSNCNGMSPQVSGEVSQRSESPIIRQQTSMPQQISDMNRGELHLDGTFSEFPQRLRRDGELVPATGTTSPQRRSPRRLSPRSDDADRDAVDLNADIEGQEATLQPSCSRRALKAKARRSRTRKFSRRIVGVEDPADLDEDDEDDDQGSALLPLEEKPSRKASRRMDRKVSPTGLNKMGTVKDLRYEMFVAADALAKESKPPWRSLLGLTVLSVGCYALQVESEGGWGIVCGDVIEQQDVIGLVGAVAVILLFTAGWAMHLVDQSSHWARCGLDDATMYGDDLKWDKWRLPGWPLIAFVAGLSAGATGASAGLVKAPLMMYMGMTPSSAVATSSFMLLFTSTSEIFQYYILQRTDPRRDATFVGFAFAGGLLGQLMFVRLLRSIRRQSLVTTALAVMIGLTCLGVLVSLFISLHVEVQDVCATRSSLPEASG